MIIQALRDWQDEHGAPPKLDQWRYATPEHPSYRTVRNMFGGWSAALSEAGLKPRRYLWDRDKVKQAIYEWTYRNGRPPKAREWSRSCPDGAHPSFRTVVHVFGSWSEGIRQAGYADINRSLSARVRTRSGSGKFEVVHRLPSRAREGNLPV